MQLERRETVSEYALRNHVAESTVYARIRRGELEAVKVPSRMKGPPYWLIFTPFGEPLRKVTS